MAEVKIHFVNPDMACGTYENAVLVSLLGQTTVNSMLESQRVGRELFDALGEKCLSITIIDRSARMPDGEVRRLTAEAMKEAAVRTLALVIIMEGEGMWTSAARAVLAGLTFMSTTKSPMHVVANARAAAEKLDSQLRGDAASLEIAVQKLRQTHQASVVR